MFSHRPLAAFVLGDAFLVNAVNAFLQLQVIEVNYSLLFPLKHKKRDSEKITVKDAEKSVRSLQSSAF